MCKQFLLGSVLMIGTGLTLICAGYGLDRLVTFTAGLPRAVPPGLTKTVLIRVKYVDAEEAADVLRKYTSRSQIGVNRSEQLVRITGTPRKVEQLKRALSGIDSPPT